ncbi:MAG: hypothetical protein IKS67_14010 [Victivallales bacterium]|nr:hypothetical protein [Victivallales bacterium]
MDFVKKNIGLLLFLILCLGGIVYLVILIMGQSKLKQEQLATEKQHVEFFDRLAKENLRLNDENRKKAEGKLAEADKKYIEFRQSLAESVSSRMTILTARRSWSWPPHLRKVKCWS